MPASSTENLVHIGETLKASLCGGSRLDQQVASSSKRILLHTINFKPSLKPYSLQLDNLKSKYIHLNPSNPSPSSALKSDASKTSGCAMNGGKDGEECLPSPKVILYPEEKIRLDWRKIQRVGSGLHNMGNTCFLNSTLQCLTYTAPLVNFCLSEEHASGCKQQGFCMMCELQRHIRRCYDNTGHAIKPQSILQKLKMIAKHMHWGRQEDAHEFLRYLVDGLQKACLNGFAKLDKFSKETTVVNQIFGGFLRSQVQCLRCKEKSNTYDPFLDISLDIKNVPSVERALERYVHPETLDSENAYMCPRCKQKVTAQKRFSIHKPPNILTLQLKRFDPNRMFGKISRNIQFHERLNMRPYLSNRQGEPVLYQLYAVLVHSGSACNMGHYYCYVKSPSQIWYCMNDAMVQQVNAGRVLNAEAYLLFYIKTKGASHTPPTKLQSPLIGPQLPLKHTPNHFKSMNGKFGTPANDIGMPIQRNIAIKSKPSTATCTATSSSSLSDEVHQKLTMKPTSIPPPDKRGKVSFGIKPAALGKDPNVGPAELDTNSKPRIVMQIKHGKVTTFETSPNGKAKIVESGSESREKKINKLVPYGEDSESESENKTNLGNGHIGNAQHKFQNGTVSGTNDSSKEKPQKLLGNTDNNNNNSTVIFDEKLNTTTSVPGNAHLLETPRDKFASNHQKKEKSNLHGNGNHSVGACNFNAMKNKEMTAKANLLKSLQSPTGSPSKRSDLASLSCVTSPPSQKLNATTPWQVQYQDAVASPSVGSTSSACSVNSTCEWQIKDQAATPSSQKIPERQCPGWTVTKEEKLESTGNDVDYSQPSSTKEEKMHSEDHVRQNLFSKEKKTEVSLEKSNSQILDANVEASCCDRVSLDTIGLTDSKSEVSGLSADFVKGDTDSSVAKNSFLSTTSAASNKDLSHLDTPFTAEPVDVSDTQHLLNGFLDSEEERSAAKGHKKHKKHKKHKSGRDHKDHQYEQLLNESSDSPVKTKRKKKKKKHKHRKDKDDSCSSASTSMTSVDSVTDRKKSKRKLEEGEETTEREVNRCSDEEHEESPEYEWVEKPCVQPPVAVIANKVEPVAVPTQQWDHHVKDLHHKINGNHDNKPTINQSKLGWDGSRSSKVVEELEKHSSSKGYGAAVLSWDGGKSHLDQEADKDRQKERKRHWSDEYEEDVDQGKMKKLKKHSPDTVMGYAVTHNPFQRYQEDRNWELEKLKNTGPSHDGNGWDSHRSHSAIGGAHSHGSSNQHSAPHHYAHHDHVYSGGAKHRRY